MNAPGWRRLRALAGLVALFAVTASPTAGQVIAGPNGPVEFIGLQDWDAQELFDAIQELDPDRPFHACAADMRFQLGFAQAGAFRFSTAGSEEWYTVVVGVEDSSGVHYRPTGSETVALPGPWEDLMAIAREDEVTLTVAARTLHWDDITVEGVPRSRRELAELMDADPETVDQVWDLLDRADGEEDRRLAHEVLASDSSWLARSVATLVLGNFIDDDSSWHALVESLIDPHARVGSVAMSLVDDWGSERRALSIGPGPAPLCQPSSLDRTRTRFDTLSTCWSLRTSTPSSRDNWCGSTRICFLRTSGPSMK